jgi:hypothetical protein
MGDFTYEFGDSSLALETYEWDRTWIEHTENTDAKRVFYIGDSISWGIRPEMQKRVGTEFLTDALASSKALDNPFLLSTLDLFFRQVKKPDLLIVNNGLHGWHLSDEGDYPDLLEKFLLALKRKLNCPVAVVLTTRVAHEGRNGRVQARNASAVTVAERIGCPVIDLYTPSETYRDLQTGDGVHYSNEGYRALAEILATEIRALLK